MTDLPILRMKWLNGTVPDGEPGGVLALNGCRTTELGQIPECAWVNSREPWCMATAARTAYENEFPRWNLEVSVM